MATFKVAGAAGLQLTLKEIAEIPDEVVDEMLDKSADIAVKAMQQSLTSMGLVRTHQLLNSIQKYKPKTRGPKKEHRILVGPRGTQKGPTGKSSGVTNSAVGFIHEFGAPKRNIPAKQWMRTAVETCAAEVEKVQLAVYDAWLKSKNL